MDVRDRLKQKKAIIEKALEKVLPNDSNALAQSLRYAVLSGGKRFRPLLTLSSGECFCVKTEILIPMACSIELIHNYSLVHDDLPAMDDDDLRRGRPTCHKAYGEDIALLAGDALLTLAFESAASLPLADFPERKVAVILELSRAAGVQGMIGGQYLDISRDPNKVDEATLLELMGKKTGALITAAVRLGGIMGGATESQMISLGAYGMNLGLAFQTRDDILDRGEDLGEDHVERPNSVRVFGESAAKSRLRSYVSKAISALDESSLKSEELHYLATLLLDIA